MSTIGKIKKQPYTTLKTSGKLEIRDQLRNYYPDVYTPEVMTALEYLAVFNEDQKAVMAKRINRRLERFRNEQRITFMDPNDFIPRTNIKV